MYSETCLRRSPTGPLLDFTTVRLLEVGFTENTRENIGADCGCCPLNEKGVRLIWGPLNTGFAVFAETLNMTSIMVSLGEN